MFLESLLFDQGNYEAVEELYQRALNGLEKALGKEHPDTLTNVYGLASVLHRQKKYKDAETHYERLCVALQKELGVSHPTTLACAIQFSSMLEEMRADGSSIE